VVLRALMLLRRSPTSGPDAANATAAPQGPGLTADQRAADEERGTAAQGAADETEQPAQAEPAQQAPQAEKIIEVNVIARSSNGGIFVRDAVLRLDSMSTKGYTVLAWRRGDLAETSVESN